MNPYFHERIKSIIDNEKVQEAYIEAKFWNSEGTLLKKLKIEVNKVLSEYQDFAFR